jgi:predicted DNA-binding transcriptional regulator AlpA
MTHRKYEEPLNDARSNHERRVMTRDDALALPPVVSLPTAAEVLGLGRSAAYELVRNGQWPTPILRLGRLIKVPTAPLIALVGIDAQVQATAS